MHWDSYIEKMKHDFLKKSIFILSFIAYLCLFIDMSVYSVIIIVAILIIAAFIIFFGNIRMEYKPVSLRSCAMVIILAVIGFVSFKNIWYPPTRVENLASKFGFTGEQLVNIAGVNIAIFSVISLSLISNNLLNLFEKNIDKNRILEGFKHDWVFLVSAIAYLCLSLTDISYENIIPLITAIIVLVFLFLLFPQALNIRKDISKAIKFYSIVNAIGICLITRYYFYNNLYLSSMIQNISKTFNLEILCIISYLLCLISIPFIYCVSIIITGHLVKIIKDSKLLVDLSKKEKLIYCLLILLYIVIMSIIFFKTDIFYNTEYGYDLVYTSDSPMLVRNAVYVRLLHGENDIRQPLFAVFSLPFVGLPYLIEAVFKINSTISAILVNIPQLILLFLANLMLSKILNLSSNKRMAFMLLIYSTYTTMLFSLMMEQYIIAYFWIILCLFQFSYRGSTDYLALYGASGTLLTSVVLMPFVIKINYKDLIHAIKKLILCGLGFIVLLLAFCRLDIFLNLIKRLETLSNFTGKGINIVFKLQLFLSYVSGCFVAPYAGINMDFAEGISWQLIPEYKINIIGLIILIVCIISLFLNRNKLSAKISGLWLLFSLMILFIMGWGIKENGLILYSLYFGWSYIVLIYELIDYVGDKFKLKNLSSIIIILIITILLFKNISGMADLLNFAVTYYPI